LRGRSRSSTPSNRPPWPPRHRRVPCAGWCSWRASRRPARRCCSTRGWCGARSGIGGLLGFAPTPYDSGESAREQGISRAGNNRLQS